MDILLTLSAISTVTIGYSTLTGLTLFNNQYQIQNLNQLFVTQERIDRYNDYNAGNFSIALVILVACIFLFIFVKTRSNIHKSVFYVFSLLFLILTAVYYIIIGFFMFNLARINSSNKVSAQAILNWSYAFVLILFSILLILQGKKYSPSRKSIASKLSKSISP